MLPTHQRADCRGGFVAHHQFAALLRQQNDAGDQCAALEGADVRGRHGARRRDQHGPQQAVGSHERGGADVDAPLAFDLLRSPCPAARGQGEMDRVLRACLLQQRRQLIADAGPGATRAGALGGLLCFVQEDDVAIEQGGHHVQ
ncbi:hypothetical protein D3C87_1590860 [compost metagenome]